ncbi:hypothetical protein ACPA9J_05295 [Pseudomonas aeruginosa]
MHFWPDPEVFRFGEVLGQPPQACAQGQGGAVPGLSVVFEDKQHRRASSGTFEDGLRLLPDRRGRRAAAPPDEPFCGNLEGSKEAVSWALLWLPEGGEVVQEKLRQPDSHGPGRHPCERPAPGACFRRHARILRVPRNLLPRGVKLAPEDVWERIAFVLSMKMQEPQFSGQTKERLSSREAADVRLRAW